MAIVVKKPKRSFGKKLTSCLGGAVLSMNLSVSTARYKSNVWAPQKFGV